MSGTSMPNNLLLKKARLASGKNQKQVARKLHITQALLSMKENGKVPVNSELMQQALRVLPVAKVKVFKGKNIISDEARRERFFHAMNLYRIMKNVSYKDICEEMNIGYSFFLSVKNGQKNVGLALLVPAVHYLKLNANYVLTGLGTEFLTETTHKRYTAK